MDGSGKYDRRYLEITGPEAISWKEIAEIISGITRQEITYVSPPVDEFKAALNKANGLAEFVDAIAGMQQAVEEGGNMLK